MELGTTGKDIGFLVNDDGQQEQIISNILDKYQAASLMNKDISISIFTLNNIDLLNRLVYTKKVFPSNQSAGAIKIPSIIYNTSVHYRKNHIRKLRQLFDDPAITFINKVNHYDQEMIYNILASHSKSSDFLLCQYSFDLDTLKYAVQEWEHVFLLPVNKPDFKKMIIITKSSYWDPGDYLIFLGEDVWSCEKDQVLNDTLEMMNDDQYFIVRGIYPLNWKEKKIEARVYVQKIKMNEWRVIHMIAKNDFMGYNHCFIHETHELDAILQEIFPNTYQYVIDKFKNDSIRSCTHLEKFLPDLASCYLDYLMDEVGNPYLVFFSGWEQQEWLSRMKDQSVWTQYWGNALSYLIQQGANKVKEGNI